MRLDRVAIRNYKSIKSIELRIPQKEALRQGSADFLSIVGENNAGKSSIVEAIRLACTANMKVMSEQFPGNDATSGPVEVELEFDQLTDTDKELAALTASTYSEGGQQRYRLKRVWKAPGTASENWAYTPERPPKCQLTGWTSTKQILTLKSLRGMVGTDELWTPFLERFSKEAASTKVTLDELIEIARELKSPLLVAPQQDEWTPYPSGSTTALEAALPNVVYVPALRETTEETDVGAKASSIRKIVNSLFEQHLSNHDRVVQFRKAAEELQDLFATEGKHRIVSSMEEKLTEKFKELINISAELTFNAPDVTSDLASSTQFRVLDAGLSTRPDHQGHGAQRSIVLALLQLYVEQNRQSASREHQHMLFLIEEPEIYLHPGMCRRMRDTLLKIARSGIGQVICTTHSPVFLDLADRHDGIVILRKKQGHPVATQRTQDVFAQSEEDHQQRARLRMLLNFDPAVNEAFFSEQVCLVEGDCEIAAVEATARKLHALGELDLTRYLLARRATTFINCRGKWTIPAFQKVLNAFGIGYRVIYDRDQGANADRANAQIAQLLTENSRSHVHEPNFEKDIFDEIWTTDKPWTVTRKIGESTSLNDRLRTFFAFAVGQPLAQLKPEPVVAAGVQAQQQRIQGPARRNLRNRLKEYTVPPEAIQSARKLNQIFRIAAGLNIAPSPDPHLPLQTIDGTKIDAFAIVTGSSMADTLQDQDIVALRFLDGVHLDPVDGSEVPSNSLLPGIIENDGIYVLATNDYIDQGTYTMKRVRISTQPDGTWNCEIRADNPETLWGHRGRFNILKTDRIHFAAQVIGLVRREAPEPAAPGSADLTFIPTASNQSLKVEDA
ncbi:AAA family ATPase [Myxococcus qinghaiensis]|uniref:AAA family ATPase n=1 Tax=Myxococcus qinghaiensis TaxID=2906758 RepID=UPI0020A74178|nr:AAA family ATPase [Myxococcus qinghaiensis]MCP3165620.1 AAA family ATPase [Myxococcus qinghaiensis]